MRGTRITPDWKQLLYSFSFLNVPLLFLNKKKIAFFSCRGSEPPPPLAECPAKNASFFWTWSLREAAFFLMAVPLRLNGRRNFFFKVQKKFFLNGRHLPAPRLNGTAIKKKKLRLPLLQNGVFCPVKCVMDSPLLGSLRLTTTNWNKYINVFFSIYTHKYRVLKKRIVL